DDDIGRAIAHLGWTAQRRRAYPEALRFLDRGLREASERGWELRRAYLLGYLATVQVALGRGGDAVETSLPILGDARGSRVPRIIALTVVGRVRARRGQPEAWPLLDEALSLAERGEELQTAVPVAVARAEASWLEDDRDGVERVTSSALALTRRRRAPDATAELVSWRRRAGIVDRISDDEIAGPYALEIAGDWPAAASIWRELGCPYEAALALSELDDADAPSRAVEGL